MTIRTRSSGVFADGPIRPPSSAILANACGIIFVHNHPSGDCQPSETDLDMFLRLRHAGEILGIDLLDAIVIGQGTHYSACTSRVFPASSL